jgi:protein-L-isoaspartate(D-aspartate) O-methyltransferase
MNLEQARFNMIEQQIRPWEVLDTQVLSLLAMVRREDFVPKIHRDLAFADLEIPLPPHSHPSQCMLSPKVEARLLQDLAVQKHEKVLEIGAGSGYMAALLAHRAAQVISLEIEPSLAAMARENLQRAFDVIVLSGSVAELPEHLKGRLAVGGRLTAIVGSEPVMSATLLTRVGEQAWRTEQRWETVAPRLQHFPQPSSFRF